MKHQYVIVLFALIITSSMVSFTSYRATEREVNEDMSQALALALDEQQSDVISADTIQIFNRYLQIEALRGNALLAVDTRQGFRPRPHCSMATIFALSDQRPAMALWTVTMLWDCSVSGNVGKKFQSSVAMVDWSILKPTGVFSV